MNEPSFFQRRIPEALAATMATPLDVANTMDTMKRADLPEVWRSFEEQLATVLQTASTLTITHSGQKAEMELARRTRLTLRNLRTGVEAKRKELGEHHLRETQKINSGAKALRDRIETLETRMLEQEEFIERTEAARRAALKAAREKELFPHVASLAIFNLEEMTEEEYAGLLARSRADTELRAAEAERKRLAQIEFEQKAAEERARLEAENARLRAEAIVEAQRIEAERVQQARINEEARQERLKEQARIEAALAAERADAERRRTEAAAALLAEQEKAEAALAAAKAEAAARQAAIEAEAAKERATRKAIEDAIEDAEAARLAEARRIQAERQAAERAAALAPDQDKLCAYADALVAVPVPAMNTAAGLDRIAGIRSAVAQLADSIRKQF